jgi:hypothetical protein
VATLLVLLPLAAHLFDWLDLRLPLRTSPLVTEAMDRANDHAGTPALLGTLIRVGWLVKGYITPERPNDAVEAVVTAPDGTATRLGQHRSVGAAR